MFASEGRGQDPRAHLVQGLTRTRMPERVSGAGCMPNAQTLSGYDVDLDSWTTCAHVLVGWVLEYTGSPATSCACTRIWGKDSILGMPGLNTASPRSLLQKAKQPFVAGPSSKDSQGRQGARGTRQCGTAAPIA